MTYSDSDYRIIKESKFFDADWYRKQYPEVDENNYDPVVHYLILGWSSGKNPGPNFDKILNGKPCSQRAAYQPTAPL